LGRLVELATQTAGESHVDIAVQHLDAEDRAAELLQQLREQLGERLHDAFVADVGAVIGAHTGPGAIGVTVHRRP
jgi:fatty acid-binding protein DegV